MSETVPQNILEELLKKVDSTPVGIVRALTRAGYEAYIVGGAVRDLLLGKVPKDYDISTSATPEQVRRVFGRRKCHVIGRRFRLALVWETNDEIYEVSTFRRTPSISERQGRVHSDGAMIWSDNCFGTLEDDARRRDFTVNSMYLDVSRNPRVIDFSGGYRDLRDGIVRCIGNPSVRMEEDPVRMLRALKLVGQCNFRLEATLEAVIRKQAPQIRLSNASRLFEELLKLLANPSCDHTFEVLHDMGFLRQFLPTIDEAWDEQEGLLLRHLLKLRGAAIRRGSYSNSRGLALATFALPFMMSALNPENPAELWNCEVQTNPVAKRALDLLFEGVDVPKMLGYRVMVILNVLPKLLKQPVPVRWLNHVEYRYSRSLLALLVQVFGWDPEILNGLPLLSPRYNACEEVSEEEMAEEESAEQEEPSAGASESSAESREFWLAETQTKEQPVSEKLPETGEVHFSKHPATLIPLVSQKPDASRKPETDLTAAVEAPKAAPKCKTQRKPKKDQPEASKSAKPVRRKKSAPHPDAPENSPALQEDAVGPQREETPIVEAPPATPPAAFFDMSHVDAVPAVPQIGVPEVKTRKNTRRKTAKPKEKNDGGDVNSITFG